MQVTVTKIGKARSGKPIAYFDQKHGQTDGFLVSDKCNVPIEGMVIDADTASSNFKGSTFWWLNGYKVLQASPQSQGFTPPQGTGNGQSAPVAPPAKGWSIENGDLSRFVSNLVGQAISGGLIKTPAQVMEWTLAGYDAGNALRTGTFKFVPRPDPNEDQDRDPDGDLNDDLASSWSQATEDRVRDVPF